MLVLLTNSVKLKENILIAKFIDIVYGNLDIDDSSTKTV